MEAIEFAVRVEKRRLMKPEVVASIRAGREDAEESQQWLNRLQKVLTNRRLFTE